MENLASNRMGREWRRPGNRSILGIDRIESKPSVLQPLSPMNASPLLISLLASSLLQVSFGQPLDVTLPKTTAGDADSVGYAVVVGVDTYKSPSFAKLTYAVRDADDIASELRANGWVVALLRSSDQDASRRPDSKEEVLAKLRTVAEGARRKDRLLFYFSGHGFAVGRENYVCVSNTKSAGDTESALSQTEILDAFARGLALKRAIVLDACRSPPEGVRNVEGGFTRMELAEARGIWHLYSAAPGFRSFEPPAGARLGEEPVGNGWFTHFLKKGLRGAAESNGDGFITLVECAMYLQREMHRASVADLIPKQDPYLLWDGQVGGDFLLTEVIRDGGSAPVAVDPKPETSPYDPKRLERALSLTYGHLQAEFERLVVDPRTEITGELLARIANGFGFDDSPLRRRVLQAVLAREDVDPNALWDFDYGQRQVETALSHILPTNGKYGPPRVLEWPILQLLSHPQISVRMKLGYKLETPIERMERVLREADEVIRDLDRPSNRGKAWRMEKLEKFQEFRSQVERVLARMRTIR